MCVCERERERESACVRACVCVCVCERERERIQTEGISEGHHAAVTSFTDTKLNACVSVMLE